MRCSRNVDSGDGRGEESGVRLTPARYRGKVGYVGHGMEAVRSADTGQLAVRDPRHQKLTTNGQLMNSTDVDVSIVVSTYNRSDMLPAALRSLGAQDACGLTYEVVVVDNNSTDRTRQVIEELIASGHANVRYVFEGRQGLSHGRNAGIAAARGAIIAFTDDDVRARPDWVARLKRTFDAHPDIDYAGGKVLPRWSGEPPGWLTRAHWSPLALVDHGDQPFYITRDRFKCLVGANMAFRREVFVECGLFAPDFQRVKDAIGSTEDHEFQTRLLRAGKQGLYDPTIVVNADVQPDRQAKSYHRRWHVGHGRFIARMSVDEDHQLPGVGLLLGVPAYFYRQAALDLSLWPRDVLAGRSSEAFERETRLRFLAGYLSERRRDRGRLGKTKVVWELVDLCRALIARKG